MSEHDDFVYEWFYDEEEHQYTCVGQVFILGVAFSEEDNAWIGLLWDDSDPCDEYWETSDEDDSPVVAATICEKMEEAMEWCETKDVQEATFDSGNFRQED